MFVPERLRTIASFIEPNEKVADVGADHGILELLLITRDTNNKVVAIENKRGPYNILKDNIGAIKNIRLSLSDGITAVDKDVDTVVLAGMGGINIVNILQQYPKKVEKINKIIVDAHTDGRKVREYLTQNGFEIKKEKIVSESKYFYIICVFENTGKKVIYNEDELEFGYKLYQDPLWNTYKDFLIGKLQRKLNAIEGKKNLDKKRKQIESLIERLSNYGKN